MKKYSVNKESLLLEYLYELLSFQSKKEVKQKLTKGMVYVNGSVQTKFNYPLKVGDEIEIGMKKKYHSFDILYEDDQLIVINKPSGMLSIATDNEKEKTAYHQVRQYLKAKDPRAKVFVVHRLDQHTSGVLMFAKSEKMKQLLQQNWNDRVRIRGYMAIVEGQVKKDKGTIRSYLKESKTQMVYSTKGKYGKLAITHFQVKNRQKKYTLLEVFLDTGRKNQIRVHMKEMGHPIVGDVKYGASTNPIGRLGLHSHILEFEHPIMHKMVRFEAKMPNSFQSLF